VLTVLAIAWGTPERAVIGAQPASAVAAANPAALRKKVRRPKSDAIFFVQAGTHIVSFSFGLYVAVRKDVKREKV
jgi:hypothetical protein